MITNKGIQKELLKRTQLKYESSAFNFKEFLFDKQLKFVEDKASFKVAVCSRRAGKSTGIAGDLVYTAAFNPECTSLYITGSRTDAKKIIWGEVLKFNRIHKLKGIANISELTLTFPNGSLVRLGGAKDEQEISKFRGQMPPIKKVFIDECQNIRDSILTKLIDDILDASLLDFAGSICLTGTPGAVKTGYFYRISHNLDSNNEPFPESIWSVHHWTFFDNPFIPQKAKLSHESLLNRTLKRRGVGLDNPSIQREFFGKWEADIESLLVKYNKNLNNYDALPKTDASNKPIKYNYILGIDIGFRDADAIAVLAWTEQSPCIYLVEEKVQRKQDITDLMNMIKEMQLKYDVSKMIIDAGALGKKISEELIRRHQLPLIAADKVRKMENIALLNDYLATGKFKARHNSKFAQDSYLVEIDRDKSTPDKIRVSDKYHSDIIDAVLYAFKESYAYTYKEEKKGPKPWSKEWLDQQQSEFFDKASEHFKKESENPYKNE